MMADIAREVTQSGADAAQSHPPLPMLPCASTRAPNDVREDEPC